MRLDFEIKVILEQSKKAYCSPRIAAKLRKNGWIIWENRVATHMKFMKIISIRYKKYRRTDIFSIRSNIFPNILNRNFNVSCQNKVCISNIIHIKINNRWYYLSIIIDLFSRKIIGWKLSSSLDKNIVIDVFKKLKIEEKLVKI